MSKNQNIQIHNLTHLVETNKLFYFAIDSLQEMIKDQKTTIDSILESEESATLFFSATLYQMDIERVR